MGEGRENRGPELVYRFGPYEVDRASGQVRKYGTRIRLAGQPLQVLYILLERAGETVTREELKERLWPADVFVRFETSLNSAVKKLRQALNDNADLPRYIETQSRRGYRFVARVETVQQDPEPWDARPRSEVKSDFAEPVLEVSEDVDTNSSTMQGDSFDGVILNGEMPIAESALLPTSAGADFQWHWRKWAVAAAILLLAFSAGRYMLLFRHRIARAVHASPASAHSRSTIAVLGFKNLSESKDENWLSVAFSEMISTELQQDGRVRAIPTETIAQVKRDLDVEGKEGYTRESLRKLRDALGCDYVVAGSYVVLPGADSQKVRLDLRVQESLSAETLTSLSVTGKRDEIFDLVTRAGKEMRNRLGGDVGPEADVDWRTLMPTDPDAAQAYSEGIAQLQLSEGKKAAESLAQANSIEPDFALGHSALAEAWSSLGYWNRAQSEAVKAVSLTGSAPRNVRLNVEARQYELQQDWKGAVAAYEHLFQDYPDDLDIGLKLVTAEVNSHDLKAAMTTIASLRALPDTESGDPRIDLAEASIAKRQGNVDRQKELARSAEQKAQKRGFQLLFARAKLLEGAAIDAQAQWPEAIHAYQDARSIFEHAGNPDGAATALNDIAIVLERQGDMAGARETLQAARREFEEIGDEGGLGAALANLGENYRAQGEVAEAQKSYEGALAIFVKTGRADFQRIVQNNLGRILLQRGEFQEARQKFEDLLHAWQSTGDPSGIAHAQLNLADAVRVQGDDAGALQLIDNAANTFQKLGDRSNAAQAEATAGLLHLDMGDVGQARRALEQALKANQDLGAEGDAAMAKLQLARVAIEEGNPSDAITQSTTALNTLKKEKRGPTEVEAEVVLANALLAAGKTSEAKRVLSEASQVHDADWLSRFELKLVASRVTAALGDHDSARRSLNAAEAEARKAGCGLCNSQIHNLKNLRASL